MNPDHYLAWQFAISHASTSVASDALVGKTLLSTA